MCVGDSLTGSQAYRNDPKLRVIPYDLKKAVPKVKINPDEAWLARYDVDRRSIFIGNLPGDEYEESSALEDLVTGLVEEFGEVKKVHVVRKDSTRGSLPLIAKGKYAVKLTCLIPRTYAHHRIRLR